MQHSSSGRWHALFLGTLSVLVLGGTVATVLLQQPDGAVPFLGQVTTSSSSQAGTGTSLSSSSNAAAALPGGVTLSLRPHCVLPDQQSCPTFPASTPTSLESPSLPTGDVLDVDIVVHNEAQTALKRVRALLQYDPTVLEGIGVIPSDTFPTAAPLVINFDTQLGLAVIDVETAGTQTTSNIIDAAAEVQFIVKHAPTGGVTVLAFSETSGDDPRTAVLTADIPARNVLSPVLGSLTIPIAENQTASGVTDVPAVNAVPAESSGAEVTQLPPAPAEASSDASSAAQIENVSSSSESTVPPPVVTTIVVPVPPSEESSSSVPVEEQTSSDTPSPAEEPSPPEPLFQEPLETESSSSDMHEAAGTGATTDRSTFVLLQVQNVRVTTEGTSLYIAWDALPSPSLQGYNVYYGTEMGRYIQRRSVRPTDTSMAVRSLVQGTRYYVAVRGFNETGEETAFSKEAAVQIGAPETSTAPLRASTLPFETQGTNPLTSLNGDGKVPGESGIPSTILLFLCISAIVGTLLAFRRQWIAASAPRP